MKKLNLLSKAEMKQVVGGVMAIGDACYISVTDGHGGSGSRLYIAPTENGSSWANDQCVRWIANHEVATCSYDCEHDGFGQ